MTSLSFRRVSRGGGGGGDKKREYAWSLLVLCSVY